MLRQLAIAKRLMLAFCLMGLLTVIVSSIAIIRFNETEANLNNIADRRLPSALISGEMNREFLLVRLHTISMLHADNADVYQKHKSLLNVASRNYRDASERVSEFHKTAKGSATLNKVTSAKDRYDTLHKDLVNMIEQGNFAEAKVFQSEHFAQASQDVTNALSELAEYQKNTGAEAANRARQGVEQALTSMVTITVFAIIVATLLAWLFGRSLIQPIQNALAVSKRIASGDLSQSFTDDAPDEAGEMIRAMAEMQNQLQSTLNDINQSSSQLATTSEELSNVTLQSTRIMHQQSNELEQAATAVTELTTAIEEVARNAAATSQNSEQADDKAKLGKEQVENTIRTINLLETELQQTRERINKLAGRVGEISTVLDVIRAIAEQTNLLALNAAIEAARAGESGRGFAVVADEVRALAHRTQESTKEIERMMNAVQVETRETVTAMTSSSSRASDTLKIAHQAGEALQIITEAISQISGQNLVIATAAEEQATVAREVDKNLVNIRDLSQQTSSGANETQASSAELARLADHLSQLVTQFRL